MVTLRLHLQARRFRRADPRKFDLSRYFLAVYADTAGSLHHTKTALLRRLLEEQSLDVATTCMVGDRNFDIEAARANGVTPIAVTYGYGTSEELASARPDHTCHAVEDLLPIFSAFALARSQQTQGFESRKNN